MHSTASGSEPSLVYLPTSPALQTEAIVAQVFRQDVLGDIRKGWNNFVESGQIWALLIGIVAGYMLKSITSSH
ncbi:hypothetical protein SYN63AY4M2_06670 [Synechococcus sp. 63AY4M2]|uniref:hypothetical protein n=1 Tax=unclassified Synechococcus TaxID=2626047 RepID=UPI0000693F0A|nr:MULTISPECIES: hypothetical protein [unclassified Synechococcus]ABC98331.1 conserved hypothetical protein [Synechococcus sp. JA-3-3Ab]PIK86150.1 hypothetical protein SYN63AY4M2_06670 [Synechococcus sp. 63AY4M2]PIK91507.1 hypothetical protein SYN65AY6LI_04145 [Synechococcus sp. 65AY6Li]